MDAIKYFNEKARMTKFCHINCNNCSLSKMHNGRDMICRNFEMRYPEEAIQIVEDWSRNHPQKTYNQDFFEKFPDARKDEFGDPFVCRRRIYKSQCVCSLSCHTCWNAAIEKGEGR